VAEFLRVTLQIAKQSHALDTATKQRIGVVLALYETERDEYLLNQGYTPKQVGGFAESAALALVQHLEDMADSAAEDGAAAGVDWEAMEAQWDDHSKDSE
jgi:hypothetical protein